MCCYYFVSDRLYLMINGNLLLLGLVGTPSKNCKLVKTTP